jgi:tetratricopeptide (TPR) repeat protein
MFLPAEQVSDSELDEQQAQLLDVLRRYGGKPVSYQQLRDAGIEYPASVVSELELAGLPLERAYEGPLSARRLLGVRIDPRYERAGAEPQVSASSEAAPPSLLIGVRSSTDGAALLASAEALWRRALRAIAWLAARAATVLASAEVLTRRALRAILQVLASAQRAARPRATSAARSVATAYGTARARRRTELGRALGLLRPPADSLQAPRPRPPSPVRVRTPRAPGRGGREALRRWLAPAALIAAAALVAMIVAGGGGGAGSTRALRSLSAHQPKPAARGAAPSASARTRAAQQPGPARPSTPVSPALAAQLEARGHALLQEAQFASAISILRHALAATGEKLESCLEPSSETCLTYAYALYDLGRALRLDRQPGTAVPVLERRLQIDNQRSAVHSELERARQEAGAQGPV